MLRLTEEDHAKVSAAIAAAELKSDGEILAVATPLSDPYHDVALHWAVLVLIAELARAAACPSCLDWWLDLFLGGWRPEPTLREYFTFLLILAVLKFTVVLMILKYMPLRLALTPGTSKTRRVRRRAIAIFKAGAELVVLSGASHGLMLDRAGEFNAAVLEFLSAVRRREVAAG